MDWPELLDHPFWAQVLKEEEDAEEGDEEDEEGHQEEINGSERFGSATLRHKTISGPVSPRQDNKLPDSHSAITTPAHGVPEELTSSQTTAETHRPPDRRTDCQQAVRHTTCGVLRNNQGLDRERRRRGGGKDRR